MAWTWEGIPLLGRWLSSPYDAARRIRDRLTTTYARASTIAHQRQSLARVAGGEMLQAVDIAEAVGYIATRPRHVAVNEILIRPTTQE